MFNDISKNVVDEIRKITDIKPQIALILGSNLGDLAKHFDIRVTIPFVILDSFPIAKTSGHKGRFLFGYINNIPIVIMQGRIHYYEGYSMKQVILPVKVMYDLGVHTLFITNSASAINKEYDLGDLVIIEDHIMLVPNPLREIESVTFNKNNDLNPIYSKDLIAKVEKAAENKYNFNLRRGVYCQCQGPNLETPAEIKFLALSGADMLGMSSACEAIFARYLGIKVCAMSCIYSFASGISSQVYTYSEMKENVNRIKEDMLDIIKKVIGDLR